MGSECELLKAIFSLQFKKNTERKKIIMIKKKNKQNTVFASNFIKQKKTFSRFFAIKIKTYLSRPNIVAHFRKWSTILLKKKARKQKKTRTFFVKVSFLKAKKKIIDAFLFFKT